jgi:O-antigen/teichoic acid export membrane protein
MVTQEEARGERSRRPTPRPMRAFSKLRRTGRVLSWGVADQAVSSLSNFAVNIYIARLLGAEQYGIFGVVYVTYAFALNASRGLATDPLMVRFSHVDRPTWRRVVASSSGTAVSMGALMGVAALLAAAVLGGTLGLGFLALAVALPGLLLQDSWRFAFFSCGRGAQAFLNDLIWLAVVIPALIGMQRADLTNVFWAVLAWGGAATVAAAVGVFQAGVLPRLTRTRQWLSEQRDLGFRYMVEGTTNNVASQVRTYGIGLLLGLAAVGYVQAAITLMAPVVVLVNGTGLILLPEATRIWRETAGRLLRFCVVTGLAYAILATVWGATLLVCMPKGLGQALLKGIWEPTYPLVLPTALGVLGFCIAAGAGTGLKGTGAARRSLRAAVVTSVIYVGFSLTGAVAWGTEGAVWGSSVALWCGAAVYWWQFVAGLRESSRSVPGLAVPGGRLA